MQASDAGRWGQTHEEVVVVVAAARSVAKHTLTDTEFGVWSEERRARGKNEGEREKGRERAQCLQAGAAVPTSSAIDCHCKLERGTELVNSIERTARAAGRANALSLALTDWLKWRGFQKRDCFVCTHLHCGELSVLVLHWSHSSPLTLQGSWGQWTQWTERTVEQ